MRTPTSGAVPVAGRPRVLRLSFIDVFIFYDYHKRKLRGMVCNFRPGSSPSQPMTLADSEHRPAGPYRRVFISRSSNPRRACGVVRSQAPRPARRFHRVPALPNAVVMVD
jgi:hypothetical protein